MAKESRQDTALWPRLLFCRTRNTQSSRNRAGPLRSSRLVLTNYSEMGYVSEVKREGARTHSLPDPRLRIRWLRRGQREGKSSPGRSLGTAARGKLLPTRSPQFERTALTPARRIAPATYRTATRAMMSAVRLE